MTLPEDDSGEGLSFEVDQRLTLQPGEAGHLIDEEPRAFLDRRLHALQRAPHKLIVSSRGRAELYDLARDAAEQRDLAGDEPALRDALAAQLAEITRAHPPLYDPERRAALRDETREALEQLGYLEPSE